MTQKNRSHFFLLLKVIATILLLALLFNQCNKLTSNPVLYDKIIGFYSRPNSLPIGVLIFILVLVNYSLESLKWCAILKPLEEFSFWKALKSVLVGVLFSIFTPARIGELGGRIIELKKENRLVGTAAVLVGSVAQNIGILFLGLFGLIWFVYANNMAERLIFVSMLIITVFLFFIAILCYFNINRFIPFAKKLPWPKRIRPYLGKLSLLTHYSTTTLRNILFISIIRIMVWTFQYVLIMLLLTGDSVHIIEIAVILMIFLIQTGIPLPSITGLLARSGVAVFMWSQVNIDQWNALAATFVIFFYNLIIPSLVGLFVLIFNRNNLNENI